MPILSRSAKRLGVTYGKPEQKIILSALEGADLVHIAVPFGLGNKAEQLARGIKIPVIASVPLDNRGFLELSGLPFFRKKPGTAYWYFYNEFYCKFSNLICASEPIREALPAYDYSARLHVITDRELEDAETGVLLESIYSKAIEDDRRTYNDGSRQVFRRNWAILPSSIDVTDPYKKVGLFFRVWHALVYYWIAFNAGFLVFLIHGLRRSGMKNLRGFTGGAVTVSNHIHNVDGAFIAAAMLPKRLSFTSIEGNFRLPLVRWLVKWASVVPIPTSTHRLKEFFAMTTEQLSLGKRVHFYPEGSLWPYSEEIRPFKKGAFRLAADAGVPVIPLVILQRKPRGPLRLFRKNPLFSVHICAPIYPDGSLSGSKQVEDMRLRAQDAMTDVLEKSKKKNMGSN
jgi:1-acyl-sn-glycerol-3-phosphate acyltransferase